MAGYQNLMETIVANKFEEISDTLGCCLCENCRNDIMAYALNRLPAKYVSTVEGAAYLKVYSLRQQHDTDVMTAITQGAVVVAAHPRHSN